MHYEKRMWTLEVPSSHDGLCYSDTGLDAPIPLPNVSSKILAKVIEYCKYHVDAEKKAEDKPSKTEEEIKTWDTDFVKVDQSTLFELILVHAREQLCIIKHQALAELYVQSASN